MIKFTKQKKSKNFTLNISMSSDHDTSTCKVSKERYITIKQLFTQGTAYLYALITFAVGKYLSSPEKSDKHLSEDYIKTHAHP